MKRAPAWLVPVLLFVVLALAPLAADAFWLSLLARAMILGMAAMSLGFLIGGAGLVSFGHAAFLGIGAYAVAALDAAGVTGAAIVVPTAVLAAALFALVTGAVSLRTGGVHFIMITLAFGQMAFFTAASLAWLGGDDGVTLYARTVLIHPHLLENGVVFHLACLVCLALTWLVCAVLLESRFGRVLRAARENPARVEALGFAPTPYRLVAYVIAGAIAGLAGVLLANEEEFVSPAMLAWPRSGELLFMVILGGAGRLWGAVPGALAFVLLEQVLSHAMTYWRLVFGPLLIACVLFLPGGLAEPIRRRLRA